MTHRFVQFATDEQIEMVYRVMLGRDRDPHAFENATLPDIVLAIAGSEEFSTIRRHIENEGNLPTDLRLQFDSALVKSAAVLKSVAGVEHAVWAGATNWRSAMTALLHAAMEPNLRLENAALLAALRENGDIALRYEAVIFDLLSSGLDVPARAEGSDFEYSEGFIGRVRKGSVDASPFTTTRELEGLREGIAKDLTTASDQRFLHRLVQGILSGQLSHWLFDGRFYLDRRSEAFSRGLVIPWEPLEHPYLDFLVFGEERDLRPHALFSASSYRTLNELSGDLSRPFCHYLTKGQFQGAKTSVLFDDEYYREMNPAVIRSLFGSNYVSPLEHFCRQGIHTHTRFSPDFDEDFYSSHYQEIGEAVRRGDIPRAATHFFLHGMLEGRQPNPYFDSKYYVSRYPWVARECYKETLSPVEHFLIRGQAHAWKPSLALSERHVDIVQAKSLYERRSAISLAQSQVAHRVAHEDVRNNITEPLLSIIVPVHNQLSFTARFIELAKAARTSAYAESGLQVEIIIVSNGSTDGTCEWLTKQSGLRTIIEPHALGYPEAVNLGAGSATGKYLLITNNDIEFSPDSFSRILRPIQLSDDIGVVGPLMLSMDGTVQESGSFAGGDGGAFGRARGELGHYAMWQGVEDVDYVSGCFLLVSRSDYNEIGGFDPSFSPGYYEEVDFCWKVKKQLNKRVVFDPDVIIYHYEHASFMRGRPPAISHPSAVRNRRLFLARHKEVGQRPPVPELRSRGNLAKIGYKSNRLLVIEDLIPDGRLGSGFGREAEILRVLRSLRIPFDLLILNSTRMVDDYEFPDVRVYRNWMEEEDIRTVLTKTNGDYSHLWVCRTHNLNDYAALLQNYKQKHGSFIICDSETSAATREVEYLGLSGTVVSAFEAHRMLAAEMEHAYIADHIVAVSTHDKKAMESIGILHTSVIGHAVRANALRNADLQNIRRLLFVGAVYDRKSPNYDGLVWFIKNILPRLHLKEVTLTVVGPWDSELQSEFQKMEHAGACEFVGMVSESRIASLYSEAIVAFAPTRYAAGVPCKVIEAMTRGVPIVMTDLLAAQLDVPVRDYAAMAVVRRDDGGLAFASVLQTLLDDDEYRTRVTQAQRNFNKSRYNFQIFQKQIENTLHITGIRPLVEKID